MTGQILVTGELRQFASWLRYETGYYASDEWARKFYFDDGWIQLFPTNPSNELSLPGPIENGDIAGDGLQFLNHPAQVYDTSSYEPDLCQVHDAVSIAIVPTGKGVRVDVSWRYPVLEEYWQDLRPKIAAYWGLQELDESGIPRQLSASARHPGGRPSYVEDTWALIEVRMNGRAPREVYYQWLKLVANLHPERLSQKSPAEDLFDKAIRKKVQ